MTSTPTARFLTSSVKARATSSATSASISARRTSRKAASTSASDSAPRRVRRSRMPFSRSDSEFEHVSSSSFRIAAAACGSGMMQREKTQRRPRAHRAVGRLPPVSRAGRRGLTSVTYESGAENRCECLLRQPLGIGRHHAYIAPMSRYYQGPVSDHFDGELFFNPLRSAVAWPLGPAALEPRPAPARNAGQMARLGAVALC